MTRRLLTVLGVMTAAFVLVARAEQPLPVKVDAKKSVTAPRIEEGDPRIRIEDEANKQERLKKQFADFKQSLINLANRLETSSKQEDRDKAANLKLAIKKAADEGVDTKFTTLIDALRKENAFAEVEKLDEILAKNDELRKDIRNILELLLKDNRDEELRKEIERNAKLLEEIKRLIAKQDKIIAKTAGRTKTEDVLKSQKELTKETRDVAEGRKGKGDQGSEAKKGEGKDSKGGKEGIGEPKEDTKGPKGESRDGKEGKDGKQGEGKDGKGNEGKDGKAGEGKEGKEGKDGAGKEGKEGEGKDGKGGEGKDGKQGEGKDGKDGKSGEGKEGKGGEGKEGKPGEGKDGKQGEGKDGKGGEGKEGKAGEGKDGKGGEGKEGKSGEGKEGKGGEGKEGKPGEGKEGKPGDGKSGEGKPGAKPGEGKPGAKPGEGKPGSKSGSGKPSDSKAGQGKPGEGKSGDSKGKGEGKGDAKGGKPGEGKSGSGKPGESKSGQSGQQGQQGQQGEAKQGGQQGGQKGGQQPPQDNPVKKQVQDANKYQEKAEQDLEKEKRADAGKNEEEAKEKLEAARKKLEDLLKQLREEEIERLLAALQARCQHMLNLQIIVRDGTVDLDKAIQAYADKKATRADEQASLALSDKEHEIVQEAATAIRLIEADGSAVAFAEVFKQVYSDMQTVEARLRKTDVGVVTVTIENDIIATLKEMVEALKKARQENQAKQGQPKQGGGGMPQDQKLIDMIAELKMIRSMQIRVNNRTEVYGKQYKGEQAPAAAEGKTDQEREQYESIQRELKDLAGRQEKIGRVTHDIATGKNEAR